MISYKKSLKIPKDVIRSCKSKKDRRHNGQKKKDDLQNITQKTKDLATRTPLRTRVYFCWSEIQHGLYMRTNFNIGPPYGKKCFEILFLRTSELFKGKLSWVFIMIVFYKICWILDIFLLMLSVSMTMILEIISWFEVKHIMMLLVKTMTLVLKVSTYMTLIQYNYSLL